MRIEPRAGYGLAHVATALTTFAGPQQIPLARSLIAS